MDRAGDIPNSTIEKRLAGRGRRFTDAQRLEIQDAFLAAFRETGIISQACRVVNIDRSLIRYWQEQDLHNFSARYNQARAESDDAIRSEIHRRAIEGVDKPVVWQGQLAGRWIDEDGRPSNAFTPGSRLEPLTIKEYSDTLLIFLAKSRMPEFKDKVQVEGSDGGPITINVVYDLAPRETPA